MGRWTDGKLLEVKYDDKGPYVDIDDKTRKYIDKKNLETDVRSQLGRVHLASPAMHPASRVRSDSAMNFFLQIAASGIADRRDLRTDRGRLQPHLHDHQGR